MANNKLQVIQANSESNQTYLIYRYYDDANNNYEYQTYKLVKSSKTAKDFGISNTKEGRKSKLNSREMCDLMFSKILKDE